MMRQSGVGLVLLVASAVAVTAQSAPPLAFEAASVKVSPPPETTPSVSAAPQPGGRFVATNADIVRLIGAAWPEFALPGRIVGQPGWIATRFDVNAKAAGNASFDELRLMAQTLLRDRFALAFHVEQRPIEVFALVHAREDRRLGPGVAAPAVDCAPWAAARAARQPDPPLPAIPGRPACGIRTEMTAAGIMELRAGGMTIADIAAFLPRLTTTGLGGVDRTGLDGRFDFTVDYAPEAGRGLSVAATDPARGPSLFDAVEDRLHLKLVQRREPFAVMVIDRVQMPTPD